MGALIVKKAISQLPCSQQQYTRELSEQTRYFCLSRPFPLSSRGRRTHCSSLPYLSCLASLYLSRLLYSAAQLVKEQTMELVKWSLNAIDTIFSSRSSGSGEPTCPDGTQMAGYTMDPWGKWKVVCLAPLSLENIEDVYLFGTLIVGFLLIGLGITLLYRKINRVGSVVKGPQKLPNLIEMVGRAVGTQTVNINRTMESIMEKLTDLRKEVNQQRYIASEC